MPTVQLEHAVRSFPMWKAAFDRDPIDRAGLGVRRHRVFRPLEDPDYVVVELDFDTEAEAHACRAALAELWREGTAAPALLGTPQVRIVETVEERAY